MKDNYENNNKFRHEYKYMCSDKELALIQGRIKNLLSIDKNVTEDNSYNVRTLYFDDYENNCYYDNENRS